MYKGTLSNGSTVRVTFTAAAGNSGSSSLLIGFVPNTPTDPTHAQFTVVVPGGGATLSDTVHPAQAFDIRVDVPAQFDNGLLQVFENGVLRDSGSVSDVNWTYAII
jgi:hypothetical protein